jgi:hypothetical protein
MKELIIGILLFTLGQAMIWYQTNGQFIWESFRKNPFLLAAAFGTLISYILIYATRYVAGYFNGMLWPGRFIGFGTGILTFALLTWTYTGEELSPKVMVSLGLSVLLIGVQIFWK